MLLGVCDSKSGAALIIQQQLSTIDYGKIIRLDVKIKISKSEEFHFGDSLPFSHIVASQPTCRHEEILLLIVIYICNLTVNDMTKCVKKSLLN